MQDERPRERTQSNLLWQFVPQPIQINNTNPDNMNDNSYKDEEIMASNNEDYVQESVEDDNSKPSNNRNNNNSPITKHNSRQSFESLSPIPPSPQSHVSPNELRSRWQSASLNELMCTSFDSTLSQDSFISLNRSSPAIMDVLEGYEDSDLITPTSPRPMPLHMVSSNLSSESSDSLFSILSAQNHVDVDYYSVAYPESANTNDECNNNSPRNNNDVSPSTLSSKNHRSPRIDPNDNNNDEKQIASSIKQDIQNILVTGEQLCNTLQAYLGQASSGTLNQAVSNKLKLSLLSMLNQIDGTNPSEEPPKPALQPIVVLPSGKN